jgi:hypothetical protein
MRTLTFAAVIAATALHAEGQKPIDVLGKPHYEPVEVWGTDAENPPLWSIAGPGNRVPVTVFRNRVCDEALTRYYEEQRARELRHLLGDPGRH